MLGSLFTACVARKGAFAVAFVLATVALAALPVGSLAQSTNDDGKSAKGSETARLLVELTGGDTKKPIVDASVYIRFTQEKLLKDKKVEFNLKTNQKGVARSPEIPKGRILIQIVSPGWKTFGQYYEIDQDEQTIQINLERPSTRWLQQ